MKTISVVIVLLAVGCKKSEVPAEFRLKDPICNGAKSYRDIPWLDSYISKLKENRVNIRATVHHVKYKGKGYFEVMVPISSRYFYGHFDCEGKASAFLSTPEFQDYLTNQTDRVLVWEFR